MPMNPRDPINLRDLQRCCEREAGKRRSVYPRLVDAGRLTVAKADREIALMDEVAAHFRKLADAEDAKGRLL